MATASPLLSQLKDASLVKAGCLIDGQWLDVTPRAEPSSYLIPVVNPGKFPQRLRQDEIDGILMCS